MNMATRPGLGSGQADLVDDLLGLPSAPVLRSSTNLGRVQPRAKGSALGVLLRPPAEQRGETLIRRVNRPIKLRRKVINPPTGQPLARIGVEGRIGIQPLDLRRVLGTPNAEGADAKLHPGLSRLDGLIDALDEHVDVLTPPIIPVQLAARSKALPA